MRIPGRPRNPDPSALKRADEYVGRFFFFYWSAERTPVSSQVPVVRENTYQQRNRLWHNRSLHGVNAHPFHLHLSFSSSSSSSLPPPSAGFFLRLQHRVSTFSPVAPPLPQDRDGGKRCLFLCWLPRHLPLCRNSTLSFMEKSSPGRENSIVKKTYREPSILGWCHFSTVITLSNQYYFRMES